MGSATAAASTACAWPTPPRPRSPADRPLDGTWFDVDFNPAADRLRVISDRGQNLRHNLDDPTVTMADTALTIPPATEVSSGVTGAAYYNNDGDPDTATTLFTLDPSRDQVAIQSPANAGLLAATGTLGVDADVAGNSRE